MYVYHAGQVYRRWRIRTVVEACHPRHHVVQCRQPVGSRAAFIDATVSMHKTEGGCLDQLPLALLLSNCLPSDSDGVVDVTMNQIWPNLQIHLYVIIQNISCTKTDWWLVLNTTNCSTREVITQRETICNLSRKTPSGCWKGRCKKDGNWRNPGSHII